MMRIWQVLMLLLLAAPVVATDIYKTVDENGNVVYSDQPPTPDAEPIDPPQISVIATEPVTPRPRPAPVSTPNVGDYAGFAIVSPGQDETIWGTGGRVEVQLNSPRPLARGMSIVVYLNGEAQPASTSMTKTLSGVERGTHQVQAELLAATGQVMASYGPVTFHMKQFSRQNR